MSHLFPKLLGFYDIAESLRGDIQSSRGHGHFDSQRILDASIGIISASFRSSIGNPTNATDLSLLLSQVLQSKELSNKTETADFLQHWGLGPLVLHAILTHATLTANLFPHVVFLPRPPYP